MTNLIKRTYRVTPAKNKKIENYRAKHQISVSAVTDRLWDVELLHEDFAQEATLKANYIRGRNGFKQTA